MFRSTKLMIAALSLTTLATIAPTVTFAADAPTSQPSGKQPRVTPGERLQKALDSLNLTDDQKKQIDPITAKLNDDLQAIKDDKTIEGKDKMAKVKDAVATARTAIEPILTADQKATLKKELDAAREKRKDKGGDKPTPPPAN